MDYSATIIFGVQYHHTHSVMITGNQKLTPDSEQFAKNREKSGKKQGKRGQIGKKRQKSGSFFHFAPPDR